MLDLPLFIKYFLLFLAALGILLYMYTAYKNEKKASVNFFGNEKNITLRSLILICFVDGIIIGAIIGYLIFS
jgi:uncharacterized membrane protein YciS (DUF1049 family)